MVGSSGQERSLKRRRRPHLERVQGSEEATAEGGADLHHTHSAVPWGVEVGSRPQAKTGQSMQPGRQVQPAAVATTGAASVWAG